MNIIREGQIRWRPQDDVVGQKQFIERPCLRSFATHPFRRSGCY